MRLIDTEHFLDRLYSDSITDEQRTIARKIDAAFVFADKTITLVDADWFLAELREKHSDKLDEGIIDKLEYALKNEPTIELITKGGEDDGTKEHRSQESYINDNQ